MRKRDVGVAGLAVMGQNLVLNLERRGYSVAVYNRTAERTRAQACPRSHVDGNAPPHIRQCEGGDTVAAIDCPQQ